LEVAVFAGAGHFDRKFQVERTSPPTIFARWDRPYSLPLKVFTQINF